MSCGFYEDWNEAFSRFFNGFSSEFRGEGL